jgi:uncharacterized protein involved in exopolysaccharide biosynthesis
MNDRDPLQPEGASAVGVASHRRSQDLRFGWVVGLGVVIVVVVLLAAGGLVGAKYFRYRMRPYTSEAWVLIVPPGGPLLSDPGGSEQLRRERILREQTAILCGPGLLAPLASDPRILRIPELASEPDVAAALGRQLKVRRIGQADMYAISYTCRSPVQAQLVVQSVVDAYLAFQHEAEQTARSPLDVQVFRAASLPDQPD